MLRLCVFLLSISYALATHNDAWPFLLVDEYMEEFKSTVDDLKKTANNYEFHQENFIREHFNETLATKYANHYDFIVIGGGTSGSVIASRLSEIPEWKVLLLEAGGTEDIATRVPQNWETLRNTPHNWGYTTVPQNYSCLGMLDHKCTIPTGKILGGTSAINSLIYTRGNSRDYDLWADLGNEGWCFSDVLPIFKKIEDAHFEPFDKKYHHRGGPQHLQHPQHFTYLGEHALQAGKELGLHLVDYNGKNQVGISIPQVTTKCGRRSSTAEAYLEPAAKRNNLIVKPLSQVIKIIISPHTKEAQGVQYIHDGKLFIAKAEKEVIVAAGALNTPKLLMLSGIGPKEECDKHNIHLISDLKVGHHLKIRPSFIGLDFIYNEPKKEDNHFLDHFHNDVLFYLKDGRGPLTTPGVEALAYLKTEVSKEPVSYPDIELQFISKPNTEYENFRWMKLSKEHYHSIWQPLEGKKSIKIAVTLNHPISTGILKLHDNNPLHHPIIEPHFFLDEDEVDYHTVLSGIQKAIKFTHTKAMQELGITINHHPVHGCEEIKFGSEEYWKCAIKYLTIPTEDVSGTARMGPITDDDAVVNNKLKVYGVHKLRVADASVIPISMTGNLMGPSIMIGEKAAHLIIEEWK